MVVIDENAIAPPPYAPTSPPFPGLRLHSNGLSALLPNLLPHVIDMTFPETQSTDEDITESERSTLYWLTYHLRLVNHTFYIGTCIHECKDTYQAN